MKCTECGGPLESKRENYRYSESGLDYVTLVNVEVRRCKECGETELVIPQIEALHRALAQAVAQKPPRLVPQEIRFLRKHLGLSSQDFAKRMGVRPETVSRWERAESPKMMEVGVERYLRLMVLNEKPVDHYPLEKLDHLASEAPKRTRVRLARKDHDWAVAIA